LKISILIKKGKELRKGIITLTNEANAKYIFQRFYELGWLVVEARRLTYLNKADGN